MNTNIMFNLQKWFLLGIFFGSFCLKGYNQDFERLQIPFFKDNNTLEMPLVGGLNAPQVSNIDFNQDGKLDLYIFDRVGWVHLPFLNLGDNFEFAPQFIEDFPQLSHWVLLRDYNGDGIQDIFAFSDVPGISGIIVFTGRKEGETFKYDRVNLETTTGFNVLHTKLRTGGEIPLYVSTIDYPDINDIDCDGDLDVLTFNIAGGFVEFHANQSVELGFGRDSLIFELKDDCWGGFFESGFTEEVDLATASGSCAGQNFSPEERLESRHAGSTVLSLDMNGDRAKELLLGDISFNNVVLLKNGGSCSLAWMNDQESFFPGNSIPVEIPVFPATFHVDLNGDGMRDLLAAPNAKSGVEDIQVLWSYANVAEDLNPVFEFRNKSFLVDEILDFGTGAHPAFFDYNQDQLMDIVIANDRAYDEEGNDFARLFLWENVGSKNNPAFQLIDSDYLNFSRLRLGNLAPTFGDIDGDEDLDLLVGHQAGSVILLINEAEAGQPFKAGELQFDFQGIDVGLNADPILFDADDDGLDDLIVGEKDGNLNFFKNKGTINLPLFDELPDNPFWGKVDTRNSNQFSLDGLSKPALLKTENFGESIVTGSSSGKLFHFNIDSASPDSLPLIEDNLTTIKEGFATGVDFWDLDQDGFYEMIIGNERGGLSLYTTPYRTEEKITNTAHFIDQESSIQVFPNPIRNETLKMDTPFAKWDLKIYDSHGKILLSRRMYQTRAEVQLSGFPAGIYWYGIEANQQVYSGRFVKLN